ncbi:MAG: riboflavin synthase [Actinobacteria bacterium]|uniref:Riboflavin synthase n=1 Tax=freshwater metagenome TaxID=449393 RepID=A0A6J6N981_9ZZZZ|nr:riboflavin synthase [Actinomycetota bacterium]
MFTGLIQYVGKVAKIEQADTSARLSITCPPITTEIKVGDSVSVNGVCLTVTEFDNNSFAVDVMVQTLNLSSIGKLVVADAVNLELATKSQDRLGGHIVQGHVDGLAQIVAITQEPKWQRVDLKLPDKLMKYVVAQGSIALDGVSLTVGELADAKNQVTVWLIPETLANTNLSSKKVDDYLNVEVDVIAKYVERLIERGDKS